MAGQGAESEVDDLLEGLAVGVAEQDVGVACEEGATHALLGAETEGLVANEDPVVAWEEFDLVPRDEEAGASEERAEGKEEAGGCAGKVDVQLVVDEEAQGDRGDVRVGGLGFDGAEALGKQRPAAEMVTSDDVEHDEEEAGGNPDGDGEAVVEGGHREER